MSELAQQLTQQLAQRAAAGQVKKGMLFVAEFNRQWEQEKKKMFEMADAGLPRIYGKFSIVAPNILTVGVAMGRLNPDQVMGYAHPEMKAMYDAGHLKLTNVALQCDESAPDKPLTVKFDWELKIEALIVEERKKLMRQQEVARSGSRARPTPVQVQPPAKKPKMDEIADHLEDPQMLECVSVEVVDV